MRRRLKLAIAATAAVPAIFVLREYRQAADANLDVPDTYVRDADRSTGHQGGLWEVPRRISSLGGAVGLPPRSSTTLDRGLPELPPAAAAAAGVPELPGCTLELAAARPAEIARLRAEAEALIGAPLPERFSDPELTRYARHHGVFKARDAAARARALAHAAAAVAHTADWLQRHPFAPPENRQRFAHLIWWTQAPGANGKWTLHLAIGRAALECRGPVALEFANTVITEVEQASSERLRDDNGCDRVNVVMYASGANALSASRVAWVLKAVVSTLSRHFPGRLNELTLLDLPPLLTWLVRGAKKLVHAETARKVRSMSCEEWRATGGAARAGSPPKRPRLPPPPPRPRRAASPR